MNQQTPSERALLHVSEEASAELKPTAAILHVTLTAEHVFSGHAALRQAEELRRLVTELGTRGIPESAVALEGTTLDVSTGFFSRSSAVTYRVRIRVKETDRIAEALDAVASCRKATLSHVDWDYTNTTATSEVLRDCATRAFAKARTLAAALELRSIAVFSVREEVVTENLPFPAPAMGFGAPPPTKARSLAEPLAGLDLAPSKNVTVRVHLACEIAPNGT